MLYIVRHGQTDWNKAWMLQGQTDIPLNENGKQMALDAGKKYEAVLRTLDICFSSPLSRAVETADCLLKNINKDNMPAIITDDRLMEISFGRYEGMVNQVNNPESAVYDFFHNPSNYVATEEAESIDELMNRTASFYKDCVVPELKNNKNVLIVGHGAMNNSLINGILGWDRSRFWDAMTGNCRLFRVQTEYDIDDETLICSGNSEVQGVFGVCGEEVKLFKW